MTIFKIFRYIGLGLFILATFFTVLSGINYMVKNAQLIFGRQDTLDKEDKAVQESGENGDMQTPDSADEYQGGGGK